jgi:hypothetical protein
MSSNRTLIPIYTTRGDVGAFLCYPYLYNRQGEWIGWVSSEREVFSIRGLYVGWLSSDARILRKRSDSYDRPRRSSPPAPPVISPPATLPLAPLMAEISFTTLDVLDEDPNLLPTIGSGDDIQDMD